MFYSANGLNNAVVFNGIEKENIYVIESSIASKLLPDLWDIVERNGQKLDPSILPLFFGNHFASKPTEFKFTQGEIILIKQIKQHVGVKGFQHFAVKKRKCTPKLTETAVGLVYGDAKTSEHSAAPAKSDEVISSSENLEIKLLHSVNKVTSKALLASGDTANITADGINIDRSDNENIKASVPCTFCKQKKKVSYKHSKGNWIMSNLIIHLKTCSHRNEQQLAAKNVQPLDDQDEESSEKVDITPVASNEEVKSVNIELSPKIVLLSDIMIRQMSVQNIKLKNSVFINNVNIVQRKFRANVQNVLSDMTLGVIEISPNGNCLFGAVVHQLFHLDTESEQHVTMVQKLRMDVVKNIKNNVTDYLFIMKDLIYNQNPGKRIMNIEKEIQDYLDNRLSKDKRWAETESLHAISMMNKKSIVIINENDDPNMIMKFTSDFNETIIIFFNVTRDHYESVVDIDAQVLSAIAVELIKNQTKSGFDEDLVHEIEGIFINGLFVIFFIYLFFNN